jgi:hypothetical protein
VFVLAAPFCGASHAAGMLGMHPQLYAVPELCLFMADGVAELLDIFRLSQGPQADGLLRTIAQLEFGAQQDGEIAAARGWLARRGAWSTARLLDEIALRVAPRRLVVPDSETPLRPVDLRRLRRGFAQAGVIHWLRHPWTQGCLLAAWADGRLFVPPDFKDHAYRPAPVDPQIAWLRGNANIDAAFADAPPLRLQSERFEAPADEDLAALCRALGLRDDADALAAMRRPDDWLYAGYGPGTAPYGLEADVLEAFDAGTLALASAPRLDAPLPWRPDGAGFDPQLLRMAQDYGYR